MTETIVGVAYKWKHQVFAASWKQYYLALDQRTGQLRYAKNNGEVKGKADLKKVFLAIQCRQLEPDDFRLKATRIRFAPFVLVIPMFEKNTGQVEEQEFALGSLDELETWMRTFAECVGALERFKMTEKTQKARYEPGALWSLGVTNRFRFNTSSRSGYEPEFYPLLWTTFVSEEERDHIQDYGHSHGSDHKCPVDVGVCNSDWSEPKFCFAGTTVVHPAIGTIMDTRCYSTSYGDSGGFWSSFLSDSGGGGSSWDSSGGCDSGGHGDSGGCDSSGGCDGGGGGGCD